MADADSKEQKVETATPVVRTGMSAVEKPFFYFHYEMGVDAQGRIQFPAKWRRKNGGEWDLIAIRVHDETLGKDFVQVVTADTFDKKTAPLEDAEFNDFGATAERHHLSQRVMPLEFDKAGRFSLAEHFLEATGLGPENKAVLIGFKDRFDIYCSKDRPQVTTSDKANMRSRTLKSF